jgi:arylsulfatase A-like enzyme
MISSAMTSSIVWTVAASLLPSLVLAADAQRPNMIVVFVDDLGYGDWSCYGNTRVETPNVDRLAAEGVRFTRFYVAAPICSPSRVGLTTGQAPARWEVTSFLADRQMNERRGMRQWLDVTAPTLPRLLQQAGYATGHFGKWHMGGQRDVGDAPLISEYGFETSLTQFEGLGERVLATFDTFYQDNDGKRGLELGSARLGRGDVTWIKRYEVTTAFVDRAIDFMRRAAEMGRPFYVNVWPDDPHSPHEPPPEFRGDGSPAAMYDGVIRALDRDLGPLFEFVRNDPRLRENTLILVASDNGHEPGSGSGGPLRGHKGNLYEGGIRSPLIAWGPGVIPADHAGTTSDAVLSALDLPPSLLALARVEPPAEVAFDGEDRLDLLLGAPNYPRERPLFWIRPPDRPGPEGRFPDLAVLDGDMKLLVKFDGSRPELYDVATDPGETTNLAEERPELVEELTRQAREWRRTVQPRSARRGSNAR